MKSDIVELAKIGDHQDPEKWHCVRPGTYCGLIFLFSTKTENPSPAERRHDPAVGASAAGVPASSTSPERTRRSSECLAPGGMARTYLEAFCTVRPIKLAKRYSPTEANCRRYARRDVEMRSASRSCQSPCARGRSRRAHLACCTDTMTPVFEYAVARSRACA